MSTTAALTSWDEPVSLEDASRRASELSELLLSLQSQLAEAKAGLRGGDREWRGRVVRLLQRKTAEYRRVKLWIAAERNRRFDHQRRILVDVARGVHQFLHATAESRGQVIVQLKDALDRLEETGFDFSDPRNA